MVDADELDGPLNVGHGPAHFRRRQSLLEVNLLVPVRQLDEDEIHDGSALAQVAVRDALREIGPEDLVSNRELDIHRKAEKSRAQEVPGSGAPSSSTGRCRRAQCSPLSPECTRRDDPVRCRVGKRPRIP
ncbi:hypothetical protein GQ55_9G097700 [Panicum hallii var. hallii]|uniref:Uncharacterized protein n=1 Tax=Panicum hallii var. hallii TaxID=1504633 RepID=A0A2T7C1G9_9POAL|nr:hypothetical protein GQ55_9G097700 [Panicum hallii var. hallii]